MEKKLYRSRIDAKVAGVCGGIGEYFGIDPTVVRLVWVLFILLGGTGLLLYGVCMVIIPAE